MKLVGRILIILIAAALVVGVTVAITTIGGADRGRAEEMRGLGGERFRPDRGAPADLVGRQRPSLLGGLVRNLAIIAVIVSVYVVIAKLLARRRTAELIFTRS